MRPVRQTVNRDDLLSWGSGSCQVIDEPHICFIHSWAASCYNNSGTAKKMQAVSKRGRPACQANVNDAKAHSCYRFRSHWLGSGLGRQAHSVDRGPAPDTFPAMTDGVWEDLACVSGHSDT